MGGALLLLLFYYGGGGRLVRTGLCDTVVYTRATTGCVLQTAKRTGIRLDVDSLWMMVICCCVWSGYGGSALGVTAVVGMCSVGGREAQATYRP